MNGSPLVEEIKTRARIRLNAARRSAVPGAGDLRLRDLLNAVSRELGFAHFEQARQVLGGLAAPGDDVGSFWHAPRTAALLNEWFARADQALAARARQPGAYLLPYRRQFVLAQAAYVRELGLDPAHPAWAQLGQDLVSGYGTPAWQVLAAQRLRAPSDSFTPGR